MHRREFVRLSSSLGIGLGMGFKAIQKWYDAQSSPYNISQLASVSNLVENDFKALVNWLRSSGWADYLKSVLNVDLSLEGEALKTELIKDLDASALSALRNDRNAGFDDFSGNKLIEPGFPAYSLLFHAIASLRV